MKHGLVILLMGLCSNMLNAQEVISTAGAQGQSTNIQLNWTIGEPVIETLSNTNNALTQGMNQGNLTITSVYEIQDLAFTISAFPNPATEFVKLMVDKQQVDGLKYYLYDIKGKLLLQKQLENNETSILMQSYLPGTYFLKVADSNKEIKTFKIIKK